MIILSSTDTFESTDKEILRVLTYYMLNHMVTHLRYAHTEPIFKIIKLIKLEGILNLELFL